MQFLIFGDRYFFLFLKMCVSHFSASNSYVANLSLRPCVLHVALLIASVRVTRVTSTAIGDPSVELYQLS